MKPEKLNKFIAQMKIELAEAESKHPHFADGVSGRSRMNVDFNLGFLRNKNVKPPYMADSILYEEIFEAVAAYQEKDLVHAQQELAQCGAVILRTMEMLENEIENAEGAK
jgi:hypothetical protein